MLGYMYLISMFVCMYIRLHFINIPLFNTYKVDLFITWQYLEFISIIINRNELLKTDFFF